MAQFQYIDTTGKPQTIEATDSTSALKLAPNKASDSGVMALSADTLANTTPVNIPQPIQTNPFAGLREGANTVITNGQIQTTADKTAGDVYIKSLQGVEGIDANQIQSDLESKYGLSEKEATSRALASQIGQNTAEAQAQILAQGGRQATMGAISGAQADIERKLAIRNLPLTAQYQAAQGDYQAAQDTITKLATAQIEDATNKYNRKLDLIKAAYEVASGKEKTALEAKALEEERKYKAEQETISFNRDKEMAKYEAGLKGTTASGYSGVLAQLPTSVQTKVISLADNFGSADIVKKFNATVDGINLVNNIPANTKNPSDHQTIVYAFAKSLDPESVVREGEYETIKKYAQSLVNKYGKEITNAISGTGFLSEDAIANIKTAMNNNYTSRKPAYDNLYKEKSRIINNIAGADVAGEVLIDYTGGVGSQKQVFTPEDEALFDSALNGTKTTATTTQTTQNTTPTKTGYSSLGGLNYTAPTFNLGSLFK